LVPHIRSILPGYSEKLRLMLEALAQFPEGTRYAVPQGGLFVFAELPEPLNAAALFDTAVEKGVAYVPGTFFYPEGGHANTLRLNFSNSTPEQITQGMDVLCGLFKAKL
ncbi:MAG: aminotransferase class I/II-fold pyridoxal phosphate-dependent enzyme, partial [Clostridia bacterium]